MKSRYYSIVLENTNTKFFTILRRSIHIGSISIFSKTNIGSYLRNYHRQYVGKSKYLRVFCCHPDKAKKLISQNPTTSN